MAEQPKSVLGDAICPCCEMSIVDDWYRDSNGEEWHFECWNQPPVQEAER